MKFAALRTELEYVSGSRTLQDGDSLRQVLQRLDVLAEDSELPQGLKHYLSKRSYVKALAWLDDPEAAHHK